MGDGSIPDSDPILGGDMERMTLEILRLRDLLCGADAQIGELETRLSRLDAQRAHSERLWIERLEHTDRQLEDAQQQVLAVHASSSWRIGQFVLKPVAAWRRVAGG